MPVIAAKAGIQLLGFHGILDPRLRGDDKVVGLGRWAALAPWAQLSSRFGSKRQDRDPVPPAVLDVTGVGDDWVRGVATTTR